MILDFRANWPGQTRFHPNSLTSPKQEHSLDRKAVWRHRLRKDDQFTILRTAISSAKLERSRNACRAVQMVVGSSITKYSEHDMVKPTALSIGIGIGVLMLGGSGIAIPTLWSRANRAEDHRDQLQSSLREVREARDSGEEALNDAEQEIAAMQTQVAAGLETLAAAQESKRVLTNQLAAMQARDRELTAVSGTLQLRDQEMAALRQQLEQTQSDHAALLARYDGVGAWDGGGATDDAAERDDSVVAAGDLVPVPPRETVPRHDEASVNSQTTAKPAVTEPIRFDDSGWKSVAPRAAGNTVYRFPITDPISPYLIIAP